MACYRANFTYFFYLYKLTLLHWHLTESAAEITRKLEFWRWVSQPWKRTCSLCFVCVWIYGWKSEKHLPRFKKCPPRNAWHNSWADCITSLRKYSDEDNIDQVLGLCRSKFSPETIQAHQVPVTSTQFKGRESVNDYKSRDVWSASAVMDSYTSCNNHSTY